MSLILICWSVKHVIMISSGLNMHAKKLQMFVFLIFYIVNYFKIYAVKTKIINFAKFFSELCVLTEIQDWFLRAAACAVCSPAACWTAL